MNRLEQIYVTALDVVEEQFENEVDNIVRTKSDKDFNLLVKAVQRKMITNKQITMTDVETFFMQIDYVVARACNDMVRIKMLSE